MNKKTPLPNSNTTLIDIYEAAGATVNADRTEVSFDPYQLKPFEIVLTVYPDVVKSQSGEIDEVEFAVLLDDSRSLESTFSGTYLRSRTYSERLTLPVDQVKIRKDT